MTTVDIDKIELAPPMEALLDQGILTPTAFHVGALITLTEASDQDDLTLAPEFMQWCAIGTWLGRISTAAKWWIGDWLAFGEGAWGERYAQAAEATGMEIGTLQNWAYTCRQVMPGRRRAELSFTSHYAVAKLEPREQEDWLAHAVRKNEDAPPGVRYGSKELRREIKERGGQVPGERRAPDDETPEPGAERREPYIDADKVVKAAHRVWKTAARDGGDYRVPAEAFQALALALGKGD